jgi:uncharacterized protein YbcC (UPF0753/DUF2309 family)
LPSQGPITVFIHHNTLHAFEEEPFHEAVRKGGKIFGCQPYLRADDYRQRLRDGKFTWEDVQAALSEELQNQPDVPIAGLTTRHSLRLALLKHLILTASAPQLRWFVAETDALRRFRDDVPATSAAAIREDIRAWVLHSSATDANGGGASKADRRASEFLKALLPAHGAPSERSPEEAWVALALKALWRICREGVHRLKSPPAHGEGIVRHRDVLLEATGVDSDRYVHDLLIRFCAAFLDQGLAQWALPRRDEGLYACFLAYAQTPCGPIDRWRSGLPEEAARLEAEGLSPLESARQSLELLGVREEEYESYIAATFLPLRGWAGMIREVESREDRVVQPIPQGSLLEFLAVRLILERLAIRHVAQQELADDGPLDKLRERLAARSSHREATAPELRAFQVFQLAQVMGWGPRRLLGLSKEDWAALVDELEAFPQIDRRRVFHEALERNYRRQTLDAIAVQSRQPADRVANPRFQVACCLDEREESFRRHLEEITPGIETFGVAGFFNVAMYYRGAGDAHFTPLCPILIRPQQWVQEEVLLAHEETHGQRARVRKALGRTSHRLHVGTRTLTGGAFITGALGALATIPLVARVLFPRLTAMARSAVGRFVEPPRHTRLCLERSTPTPGTSAGQIGFTLDEMTNIGERLLRDIGLTYRFARVAVMIGHGSDSLNNPHNSAYNCGACGGSAGGPNGRVIAEILNDPRVRERLAGRGIDIPASTIFVGGYHNTCNDEVTLYDLERVPASHREDVEFLQERIHAACERNAHERCRRFMSADLDLSFAAAKKHVEARSADLAQVRPECGHATNAVCYVGRRSRTRGLFMDRRTFLTSYDPTQDEPAAPILHRILQAAVPVCAGINLEYYFSYVDCPGYGCGTKLPHNVTSLLGIMDGAASDLRTGLPWQMVEIHEPLRLLFVVETTPEAMLGILERDAGIGHIFRNGWAQLALLDPHSSQVQVYARGEFEPYEPTRRDLPRVASSPDWYRGRREHLAYASVDAPASDPMRSA